MGRVCTNLKEVISDHADDRIIRERRCQTHYINYIWTCTIGKKIIVSQYIVEVLYRMS